MKNSQIIYKIAAFSFLTFALVYVVIRAVTVSFTIDECLSFSIFTSDPGMAATANNHLLNTWLMHFFYWVFGMSEVVLRLPNVLSFLLFAMVTYKILDRLQQPVIVLAGLFLIFVNPYFIEFFSLARGYALSWGLSITAMYFLLRNYRGEMVPATFIKDLSLSLLFCILAAYANLNMINVMFVIVVVYVFRALVYVLHKGDGRWQLLFTLMLIFMAGSLAMFYPVKHLMMLNKTGQLYFGGTENFFNNTLTSIVFFSEYLNYNTEAVLKTIRIIMISSVALGLIIAVFVKPVYREFRVLTAVMILMIATPIVQFYLLKTPYPMNRTALFYLPVYGLFLCFLIAELTQRLKAKLRLTLRWVFLLLIALPLWYNFAISMNTRSSFEWTFDQDTRSAMMTLKKRYEKGVYGQRELSIANDWLNEASINYYRTRLSMNFLKPANREPINREADIWFGSTALVKSITVPGVRVIDYFEYSGTYLAEKKNEAGIVNP